MLAIVVMWGLSAILTLCGVFPDDPDEIGYGARFDAKTDAIEQSTWLRVPYPRMFFFTIRQNRKQL